MKPNILYFIVHDLGRHLGCYGDATIPSPNLDAFAESGVRFTNFYGASTPCSPARGCLMTGRYAHDQGLMGLVNHGWSFPTPPRTLAHDLADNGYFTQLVGFQHESPDPATLGYQSCWCKSMQAHHVADRAIEFLRTEAAARQPFFLSMGTFEVHLPFKQERYRFDDPAEVALPSFLPDNETARRQMAMFHGAIRFMDEQFARVLAALDESPMRDNTLVIFTTDHGMAFPRAKSTLYDPGIRVAMLMRLPEALGGGGRVCEELLSGIDLRPTLCELVGLPIEPDVQGRSFAPLLTGQGDYRPRREIFSEKNYHDRFDPIRCIRTKRHKYIRNFREGPMCPLPKDIVQAFPPEARRADYKTQRPAEELYDLACDSGEENNLIGRPEHAQVEGELRARLEAWMRETDDPVFAGRNVPYPPQQPFL